MTPFPKLKHPYIWPLLLLVAANGLIIIDFTLGELRYVAVLVLLGFLPGWVWLQAFLTQPVNIGERVTLAMGLSLALTILGTMFTVYLPGPLTANQVLITTNALVVTGLIVIWWQCRFPPCSSAPLPPSLSIQLYSILILGALFILAAALRLPRLGYAEFHEDEAEALMLGVRLLQGEDYAIFLHRKGPAQMLLPVAFWLLTGHVSETLVRFPFALSSILSVMTLFFIGRRWFNWPTGVIAGLLWAVNGYAIGFGRMVQYQALVFFLGPLALYALYLAWKCYQPRLPILAAILLATCLLAHFDALLLLPAAAYLGWMGRMKAGKRDGRTNKKFVVHASSFIALMLFLVLLASFYIPYLFDPEFKNTVTYLSESRVKPGLLYNNLNLLQRLDQDYSSHFYLPILAIGIAGFVVWQSGSLAPKWRWGMAGLGVLLVSTWWLPDLWQVDSLSLTVLPWLLLGLIGVLLSTKTETRAAWITFGVPFIGYVFLVDDPRTHLYIAYPGVTLLAGAGWMMIGRMEAWKYGSLKIVSQSSKLPTFRFPILRSIILAVATILLGLIVAYDIVIFLQTESRLTRLRQQGDASTWQTIYGDLPKARSYFGYPKREGWKVIGTLRAQGQFPGDFRSMNEDFIVPIWYNYGQARSCYNTPAHFFVRAVQDEIAPPGEQYVETGRVQREGEVRLHIFSASAEAPSVPTIYSLETFAGIFDQLATPQQFAQQAEPSRRLETQFGRAIKFVGYDLPSATVAPGETLYLDLYWQALENPGDNYRVFVHLTDGTTLWGQQDDNPVCRLPTSIWRVGQRGIGQFRLPINPETPPGHYPLIIGLYQADTLERLKIIAGAGQPGDDFLWLQDIEVIP